MVWLLKQSFSCFWCFKIRARLGLGLVGRVGAVTTLERHRHVGCACTPCRAWPTVADSGLAMAWLPLAPLRKAAVARRTP